MRFRLHSLAALFSAFLVLFATSADAGHPHDRNGFFIGFGVGGGNAELTGQDGGSASDGGGIGNFRIGGAVKPTLTLGLENSAWVKSEEALGITVTTTLSAATFGVTWYPSAENGFYTRAGIGFGQVRADAEAGVAALSYEESGIAILAALGYEWRLTGKFAMGPQVEFVGLGIDGDLIDSAKWVDGTLQFAWYW